jgi:hypothetical protein
MSYFQEFEVDVDVFGDGLRLDSVSWQTQSADDHFANSLPLLDVGFDHCI